MGPVTLGVPMAANTLSILRNSCNVLNWCVCKACISYVMLVSSAHLMTGNGERY
jgi:hypothetical protein